MIKPLLRFDRFVFKEKDGRYRLLFEAGSSYIYIWINDRCEILCFQFLISGYTGLHFHECGTLQTSEVSAKPFDRALTGPSGLSDDEALEKLSHFQSEEFPDLVGTLIKLAKKEIPAAMLSEKERKLVLRSIRG